MKLIRVILRMSRLLVAMTLLIGLSGLIYAKSEKADPSSYKDAVVIQTGVAKKMTQNTHARSNGSHLNVPMYFEANRGQTDASVKYFTRAGGYNLYLTGSEAVMVMPKTATAGQTPGVVRMKLKGANASPSVQGLEILPGYSNYLIGGDPSKWQTGVKQYAKVKLGQVYPGIDMVYRFSKGQVEYDFVVAPGANPWRILLGFEGAKDIRLDAKGNLVLRTDGGEMTYKAPELYQTLDSKRVPVKGRFLLASNKNVRFEVGNYIKSKELVIDPALAYSNFLGGAGATEDQAYAIAVDDANNAYVTGTTNSPDFPTAPAVTPIQAVKGAGYDIFVTKVDPAGTGIVWSTYLGGATNDAGLGIAVDGPSGRAYITGSIAGGVNLPASVPIKGAAGALTGINAFVAGIAADGLSTTFRVTFGGDGDDVGNGIAIDSGENIYITGTATAGSVVSGAFNPATATFPITADASPCAGTRSAASQAFVAKFTSGGAQVYATYLGCTGFSEGRGIAVDGLNGSAYVTGNTGDGFADAAITGAFKPTWGGGSGEGDAFIARLLPSGASFDYKTYVGGANDEQGNSIAVDSLKDVYITGYTFSPDFPDNSTVFATIQGLGGGRTTMSTGPDAFVFKLRIGNGGGHNDGVYATYLGGNTDDRGTSIKVDSSFNAYVAGYTTSGDFPIVGANASAGQNTFVGTPEAFVSELNNTGGPFIFSTWLGGTGGTRGQGLALDSTKNIYLTGYTGSGAGTFPLVAGGFQQIRGSGTNTAFVTKFGAAATPAGCVIASINPANGFRIGGTTVTVNITNFTGFIGSGVTFDGITAQSYATNASSTVITAVSPRHPLAGALVAGVVSLTVNTLTGTCSANYAYVAAPTTDTGACGEDFFFPSPATGATAQFAYCMALPGTAKIRIYNVVGDLAVKIEDAKAAGAQSSTLNTARLAPGVYLYRLEKDYDNGTSTKSTVKKFVVKH